MYKLEKKGAFESYKSFEQKLNDLSMQGWRVVNVFSDGAFVVAALEKKRL